MKQKEYQELGMRFNTRKARAEFIRNAESDLYTGKTEDDREVRVFLQKGVGMNVMIEQRGKPNWWEVIMYDEDGYQEGITYDIRYPKEKEHTADCKEDCGIKMSQIN